VLELIEGLMEWGGDVPPLRGWMIRIWCFSSSDCRTVLNCRFCEHTLRNRPATVVRSRGLRRYVVSLLSSSVARRAVLIPILLAAAVNNIEMVGIGSWRPAFYERTYDWELGLGPADFAPIMGVANMIIAPIALLTDYVFQAEADLRYAWFRWRPWLGRSYYG